MRKSSFRNICNFFPLLLAAGLVCLPLRLLAFPDQEKAALGLLSSQATSFALDGDRFLYAASGGSLIRIDTQTFDLAGERVPPLTDNSDDGGNDLTGDVKGLAIRGSTLFASQGDGDLLAIALDDVTAEPSTFEVTTGELGGLAADPDIDDDQLYILDKANNAVAVFDLSNGTAVSVPLTDGLGAPVTPRAIAFAAVDGAGDKAFVTSDRGLIFVIAEGGTSVASLITLSTSNKSLDAAAVTPDGRFLLVVNSTDTVVHVIDTAAASEIDTDPLTSGTNPVSLPDNASLVSVLVTEVSNPGDTFAYVSGSNGLSVIDLNLLGLGFDQPSVIDFNDAGSGDDEDEPMPISSSPGVLAASSVSDGIVYVSDSNAAISVVTEKPFVVISGTSLGSAPLTTDGSFNLTFQSDEAGDFQVLVGGDSSANGTPLLTGTVAAATAATTSDIAFDADLFREGANRVFVFVTDEDGLRGRDAVDITVDTPPPAVEIVETGFGDEKIFVVFSRLNAEDIDHYNVYIDTDPANVAVRTDAVGTVAQTSSGETLETKITGLINGVTYFIGVEGVDAAGNLGPRTTTLADGTPAQATPEETIGLAGVTGEAGCGLVSQGGKKGEGWVFLTSCWSILPGALFLFVRKRRRLAVPAVFLLLLLSRPLHAVEYTPQWFSLEFKGGVWVPLDGTTRDFLGTLSPTGKVEFGFLYKSKFGVEIGVGFIGADGRAVGTTSGAVSRDGFSFIMIPIENSFAFRADFKEDQLLVPYVKAGPDYVFFRENRQGSVTTGMKFGLHGAIGLQILLDKIEDLSLTMERTLGVNDVYFTLEGRYGWINNFGGRGVDLSGLTMTGGFLFEF